MPSRDEGVATFAPPDQPHPSSPGSAPFTDRPGRRRVAIDYSYEGDSTVVMFKGWKNRDKPALMVPYEPIWPGFALHTLSYAVVLWLLVGGPFAL